MTLPEIPDYGNVGGAGGGGRSPGDGPPGGEGRPARPQGAAGATGRGGDRLPPVTELVVASLALMLTGGVLMAAHLPDRPPLGPPIGLLAAGAVLTTVAVVALSRARPFAWRVFFLVVRWAFACLCGHRRHAHVRLRERRHVWRDPGSARRDLGRVRGRRAHGDGLHRRSLPGGRPCRGCRGLRRPRATCTSKTCTPPKA
jgi:hypothetical protein